MSKKKTGKNKAPQSVVAEKADVLVQPSNHRSVQEFTAYDNVTVQGQFRKILRAQLIEHLRTGKTRVATHFRNNYKDYVVKDLPKTELIIFPDTFEEYLIQQSKEREWGTYVDAAVLGEIYGVNVEVAEVDRQKKITRKYFIHSEDTNTTTVLLYNTDNAHWFVDEKTQGGGNCLFNAFSQALRQLGLTSNIEATNGATVAGPDIATSESVKQPALVSWKRAREEPEDVVADLISQDQSFLPSSNVPDDIIKQQDKLLKAANAKTKRSSFEIAFEHAEASRKYKKYWGRRLGFSKRNSLIAQINEDEKIAIELAKAINAKGVLKCRK
jgi:hypothetical protein